jgi:aminopeptidase N
MYSTLKLTNTLDRMKSSFFFFLLLYSLNFFSQEKVTFSKQDSLRGSINTDRIWWDLQRYDLKISVDIQEKKIWGTNTMYYKVLDSRSVLQVDLQEPMRLTKASQDHKNLSILKKGNAYLITLQKNQKINSFEELTLTFEGVPKATNSAPWEAGFTWKKDSNEIDFVATTCQGQGASIWWPCKDHLYDEPDQGMDLHYTVPSHLVAVGNGRLISTEKNTLQNTKTYHWKVLNPINNYGVQLSIGDYLNYQLNYKGEVGLLECNYYVLRENFLKAKKHFNEVARTLEAFEYWFGPYPFYEDSYKIVEVPYLGMEHQSAIGYGNGFENGYRGNDLSGTGWGLKFDFIIVHESGHEWFGNNVTNKDIADMWIHESFANYSECMFLEYHFGKKAAQEYIIGLRQNIKNDKPIIGTYDVNNRGSDDMYYKGANMLHTIRSIIGNDATWRHLLRGLNKSFYHKTVSTKDIEEYIADFTNIDFSPVFDQYLRSKDIPVFEYKIKKNLLKYRWSHCIKEFKMPLNIRLNNKQVKLTTTTSWKKLVLKKPIKDFSINNNFYVTVKNLSDY